MTVQELIDALQKIEDKTKRAMYDYDGCLQDIEKVEETENWNTKDGEVVVEII